MTAGLGAGVLDPAAHLPDILFVAPCWLPAITLSPHRKLPPVYTRFFVGAALGRGFC